MRTIKPYLFNLLSLFFALTILLGCSNENIEANDLNANQHILVPQAINSSTLEIKTQSNNLENNLIFLTTQSIDNMTEVVNLLTKNDKKNLLSNIQEKPKLYKTDNDIEDLFEKINSIKSDKILQLIRKQQLIFMQFKKENPSFYKMDITVRNNLMIEVFAKINNKKVVKYNLTEKTTGRRSCVDAYNQDAGVAWLAYAATMALIANETPAVVTGIGAIIIAGQVTVASIVYVSAIAQIEDTYQDCIAKR